MGEWSRENRFGHAQHLYYYTVVIIKINTRLQRMNGLPSNYRASKLHSSIPTLAWGHVNAEMGVSPLNQTWPLQKPRFAY